jgi:hypothetical protein
LPNRSTTSVHLASLSWASSDASARLHFRPRPPLPWLLPLLPLLLLLLLLLLLPPIMLSLLLLLQVSAERCLGRHRFTPVMWGEDTQKDELQFHLGCP